MTETSGGVKADPAAWADLVPYFFFVSACHLSIMCLAKFFGQSDKESHVRLAKAIEFAAYLFSCTLSLAFFAVWYLGHRADLPAPLGPVILAALTVTVLSTVPHWGTVRAAWVEKPGCDVTPDDDAGQPM